MKMLKILVVLLATAALLGAAAGCGSSCSSACDKIYNECKLAFENTTEAQCADECDQYEGDDKDNAIDCIMKASCDIYALGACLY